MDNYQDIANELFILNNTTVEKLFELGSDAYILYSFYYKTAKWQNTTAPWATNEYVMDSLRWGLPRLRATKQLLEKNGLIEQDKITTDTGKITRWVVRLKYIQNTTSEILPPVVPQQATEPKTTRQILPPVVNERTNTLNNTISNYNNIYINNNNLSSTTYVFDTKVLDLWNSIAEKYKLAKIKMLTKERKTKLLLRMKECGELELDALFEKLRQAIKESTFLRGKEYVETREGLESRNTPWRATFDFFLEKGKLLKTLEGAYADPDLVKR